jgi:hypothetical protein
MMFSAAKKIAVVPTKVIFDNRCGSVKTWKGGPPP